MFERFLMKKRTTNGFGSGLADIIVVVQKPHHQKLLDHGWEIHSETDHTASFKYSCKNSYTGDDATVVFELWGDLPEGTHDHFEIDWDNSVY